jgi:hypothetical protein
MSEARGNFDVQIKPEATFGDGVGRFTVTKSFRGDLEGTGTGEMLAVRTPTAGSAGYVLIERVEARLDGKTGSFLLQHFGTMDRSQPEQKVVIIPDSGTGELAGIAGTLSIDAAANHAYVLSYSFRPAA